MKKRILFGITSLTLGGAERVLVDIANQLCEKYEITIFTIYAKGELEKQLSSKVILKSLYSVSFSELSKFQKRVSVPLKVLLFQNSIYQKKIKGDYDVEIAFLEGPITRIFSTKNEKTKKIVWVHNDISAVFGKGIKAKLKRKIDKKIYEKYRTIVFVSKDNLEKFDLLYNDMRNPEGESIDKKVIYNYIDKDSIIKKAEEKEDINFDKNVMNFVTIARLVPQKGIDRLIEVHQKLIKEDLKHNFYVIGDGPEKEKLQDKIKKYEVDNTFHLLGNKENPYPYIKESDYFCLLSNFEGYGMVLEEAKILDKPIIITDTAAREAIDQYRNSKILENSRDGIYNGIKEVIMNKKRSFNAKGQQTENYDNSEIIKKVIELIEK